MQRQARGRPIALIVEDEPLLRWAALSVIEEAGFDTLEAGNASEAISFLEGRSDVWVVFTDVQMPGTIDGLQLAHLVSIRWPPIKDHCHITPTAIARRRLASGRPPSA